MLRNNKENKLLDNKLKKFDYDRNKNATKVKRNDSFNKLNLSQQKKNSNNVNSKIKNNLSNQSKIKNL